jgi:hypothetical protein
MKVPILLAIVLLTNPRPASGALLPIFAGKYLVGCAYKLFSRAKSPQYEIAAKALEISKEIKVSNDGIYYRASFNNVGSDVILVGRVCPLGDESPHFFITDKNNNNFSGKLDPFEIRSLFAKLLTEKRIYSSYKGTEFITVGVLYISNDNAVIIKNALNELGYEFTSVSRSLDQRFFFKFKGTN